MTNYSQSMRDALELVYTRNQEKIAELNEKMSSAQIAKLKKAYEPMRNKKISTSNADKLNKLMDKVGKDKEVLIQIVKADIPFVSQSAVTKLITKHNMKGAEINKFKEEFNIESVELDEDIMPLIFGGGIIAGLLPVLYLSAKEIAGPSIGKLVDKLKKNKNYKMSNSEKSDVKGFVSKVKKDKPSLLQKVMKKFKEEVELDEKRDMSAPPVSAKVVEDDGFRLVMKFKDGTTEALPSIGKPSMQNLKSIVDKNILKNPKRKAWVPVVSAAMKKGLVKEEVELDEGKMKEIVTDVEDAMGKIRYKLVQKGGKFNVKVSKNDERDAQKAMKMHPLYVAGKLRVVPEEADLDEAILKGRDYEYDEKKGVVKISKKNFAKVRKDAKGTDKSKPTMMVLTKKGTSLVPVQFEEVEEAYEYGTTEYANHTKEVTPGQEVDEASARADAKRSMRRDPSMRKQSPFSKDMSATDDDVKAASKNIIMQMRKAVSLRGKFPVEFADKKKIKIPADIAQAVQQKYNSFKKPADKEKFQAKVGKSYKDMLRALREEVQEEKTILDRIEEIIKENKNG